MINSQQPKGSANTIGRVRRSIFSDPIIPRGESERKRFLRRVLLLHFRPATVPDKTLRFSLTWGLGGMAVVLVLLQISTGVLLKFVYEPTVMAAYPSIQILIHEVPFGRLIRNLHHWCAHLLVLVLLLHMLRVFFTGAFHAPRQFNWIFGLTMFGIILVANFTGYLLPWDQLAYWAVTVSTGMLEYWPWIGHPIQGVILDGADIGPATLRFFFAVHTAIVPVLLLLFMGFHFWRIRKAGGLVIPRQPEQAPITQPNRIPTIPNLLLRETVVATTLIAMMLVWSVLVNAPLADPANPGLSPNPTKAPWYFAGLQELLMHFHPVFAVCIIPAMMGLAFLAIPYLKYESDTSGVWFVSRTGRKTGMMAAVVALLVTPLLILISEKLMTPGREVSAILSFFMSGLLPLVLLLVISGIFIWFIKKRYFATSNELVQAVFILFLTAFIVLTMTSVWFRGEGMTLTVPW
jgi:quinol-cytochrome oxidoreductase complex cytochrome b subunit